MYHILIYIHILSALLIGIYILIPFVIPSIESFSQKEQTTFSELILFFIRVGQYALILLLLTGGGLIYIINGGLTTLWMILTTILFLIVGGALGMMQVKIKALRKSRDNDFALHSHLNQFKIYSWMTSIGIILILIVMTNPEI